jgi:hypothetical protein
VLAKDESTTKMKLLVRKNRVREGEVMYLIIIFYPCEKNSIVRIVFSLEI